MGVIERFATAGIAPEHRLRYWNDLVDRIYTGTWVNADSPDFRGEMFRLTLGDLAMIRPRSGPSRVGRSPCASGEERIILHLQSRGTSRHCQDGHETHLRPGDFVLSSPHRGYAIDLAAHEFLVVEFPRAPLAERVGRLDDALARRICGASPGGRVFHDFLLSLWRQGDPLHAEDGADREWEAGISAVFFDMLALALRGAEHGAAQPVDGAFRDRVLALIEAELCDPELRTLRIAEGCGSSPRTVQNLFASMGTTPSAYMLERRLRRAAERLAADPARSITDIAFAHGFNDSAYFTRCFRQHFGVAPREWRAGAGMVGAALQS